MDAETIERMQELLTALGDSELNKSLKLLNQLAEIGLAAIAEEHVEITPPLIDDMKEDDKINAISHSQLARLADVTTRTVSRAIKDGRIKEWWEDGPRKKMIPEREVLRVLPMLKKD